MRILVLDLPGLHLGYLGCYGNEWVGTPNIDRLASESVVFNRHYYDVRQPEPAAWTGHAFLHPSEISLQSQTLGQILSLSGISLDYIEGDAWISTASLESIVEKAGTALIQRPPFLWVRFPSMAPPWELPEDLLNSYCEEEDQPWPNPPFGPIEEADELPRLQNTYAPVVTLVDAHLEVLFDQLRNDRFLDDMLLCLTSSESLPLGEHGIVGRARPWPHEEFVHLPLLLRLPRAEHAGCRVNAVTQPVDLFPTFLEFHNIPPVASHGRNLWPLIRGDVPEVRPYALTALNSEGAMEWALRTPDWAFLLPMQLAVDEPRQPRLYVKPEDRWEVNDVRQHHLELAEDFEKTLHEIGGSLLGDSPAANAHGSP